MDATQNASGTPLLIAKRQETIEMKQTLSPVAENEEIIKLGRLMKLNMPDNTHLEEQTKKPSHLQSPLHGYSNIPNTNGSSDLPQFKNIPIRVFLPHLFKEGETDIDSTCIKVLHVNRIDKAEHIIKQVAGALEIENDMAHEVFALWMNSDLLELQLKPHHQPLELARNWKDLISKFAGDATPEQLQSDKPCFYIKRRVQLSPERELQCCNDPIVLKLLFEEAKSNLFSNRYHITQSDAAYLAGIGFAIDNDNETTDNQMTIDFIRKNLENQLPEYLSDSIRGPMVFGKVLSSSRDLDTVLNTWSNNVDKDKDVLKRDYLGKLHTCCQQYGSAKFNGYIERPLVSPLRNLKRFFQSVTSDPDLTVNIFVNRKIITVVDTEKHETILMVPISDCVWKKAFEGVEMSDQDQPMLLLHFPECDLQEKQEKNKEIKQRTNVLQIFGYQAEIIDSMLSNMLELLRKEATSAPNSANSSSSFENYPIVNRTPSLTKCDRMCLATFVNGRCVKASGSLKKVVNKMAVA